MKFQGEIKPLIRKSATIKFISNKYETNFSLETLIIIINVYHTLVYAVSFNKVNAVCNIISDQKTNIHLIPHSHNDVGWLRTVDQYFRGSGIFFGVEDAGVRYILNSTIQALKRSKQRRYIQVETAFFQKWWHNQDTNTQQDVIDLVNKGQLEMVNGAWAMNDEATTNYQSIIDQFTWGLRFLNDTLGKCGRPKVGWQIGAYGHSREHASIAKQMGFEGLILDQVDYRDKQNRANRRELEFMWRNSDSLKKSEIFTVILADFSKFLTNFCFDIICSKRSVITNKNMKQKVQEFAQIMDQHRNNYQTNNIMVPMGGQFTYQIAEVNFYNLDKLIRGFKNHSDYNVFYSTPSCYIKAVREEFVNKNYKLSEESADFFPYTSTNSTYWTGYYSSRPTLKKWDRVANNILQALKQMAAFSKIEDNDINELVTPLREAMAVMQNHNAITGTERQRVADDYVKSLSKAIEVADEAASTIVGTLLRRFRLTKAKLELHTCLLTNVSICNTSQWTSFVVVIYNPLSRAVSHYVRLPVEDGFFKIYGPDGEVDYDIFDSISNFSYVNETLKPSSKELIFIAKMLPPMGLKLYFVTKLATKRSENVGDRKSQDKFSQYFGNMVNGFSIDNTGKLSSIKINGRNLPISQEFRYYTSSRQKHPAGAYVFQPNKMVPEPITKQKIQIKYQRGRLMDEIIQILYPDKVTQIIRVYKDANHPYIEFDWLVGNLNIQDGGKELVTIFTVDDFFNSGVFYTDSNGKGRIKREINQRDDAPVGSNYYPVTSDISIEDLNRSQVVTVINDRAQGGTTCGWKNGTLELMIYRRLVTDDGFGLYENLNEMEYNTGLYVRGQHYLTFGSSNLHVSYGPNLPVITRDIIQRKKLAPWILVDNASNDNFNALEHLRMFFNFQFQSLKESFPVNLNILTLEPWKDDTFLLRLEHVLQRNDDHDLSDSVVVHLKDIFTNYTITEIKETTLGANRWLNEHEKDKPRRIKKHVFGMLDDIDPSLIMLSSMQIRTFVIKISKRS